MVGILRLTVLHTVGVGWERRARFIATSNGKPPWSTKAFAHTVGQIEYHDVVTSGTVADEFCDKHPRDWTKQALLSVQHDTEPYTVEVPAESHCNK